MEKLLPPLLRFIHVIDEKTKRRWMLKHHPDKNKDPLALEKFKLVSECYTAWKEIRQPHTEHRSPLLFYLGITSGKDYRAWVKTNPTAEQLQLVTVEFDIVYGKKERVVPPYKTCGTRVEGIVYCRHIATSSGKCLYHSNPEYLKHVKENHRIFFSRKTPRHSENACLFVSDSGLCSRKKMKNRDHCTYHEFKLNGGRVYFGLFLRRFVFVFVRTFWFLESVVKGNYFGIGGDFRFVDRLYTQFVWTNRP